ncbi:MAG: PilZ domain-containing protein [Myxococcota bacterium]|nr:PilZ domain-containing protein [Myxococcota bacterium]
MIAAAALQRIRSEIAQGKPEFALLRRDGLAVTTRYIDRFVCPLGPVWIIALPALEGRSVVLTADEQLKGHVAVGKRIFSFSSHVVAPQATLEREGVSERRVALIAEPSDYAEVQRRRWHRVRSEETLIGAATLYFESSRVIQGASFELQRGMVDTPVTVVNLSGGGVCFEAPLSLAHELQVGDLVRLRIDLHRGQEPFGFSAQVRNRQRTSDGLRYGVSFHGDDRLFGEISARALHLVFLLQTDD